MPISFRYHLVENLMRLIKAGESTAIIGMASVGKSNVVQYLQQPEVQEMYLGRRKKNYLLVWIDSNDLVTLDVWNFFELLIYRLSVHCQKAGLSPEIGSHLDDLHQKLLSREQATHAQRCFEQAIQWLCQVHDIKVVLLLDEFDLLFQELPPRLLVNLRSLRDKNKYHVSYVLFLRKDLEDLHPRLNQVEAFVELFQGRIFYLKPYDLAGAESALARLSRRQGVEWLVEYTPQVFDLSGGHAGLIKVIFSKVSLGGSLDFEVLTHNQEINDECQKIWDSLTPKEKGFLQKFVGSGDPKKLFRISEALADQLTQKGLVRFEGQEPHLFSTLFADFVRQKASTTAGVNYGFKFDMTNQICWVNGQEINLPLLPARLLELLYKKPGQPCRRLEILRYLYPNEDHSQLSRISDEPRLYDVVKNLRKKIEPNPQRPQYIKTVRGVGFKLELD